MKYAADAFRAQDAERLTVMGEPLIMHADQFEALMCSDEAELREAAESLPEGISIAFARGPEDLLNVLHVGSSDGKVGRVAAALQAAQRESLGARQAIRDFPDPPHLDVLGRLVRQMGRTVGDKVRRRLSSPIPDEVPEPVEGGLYECRPPLGKVFITRMEGPWIWVSRRPETGEHGRSIVPRPMRDEQATTRIKRKHWARKVLDRISPEAGE